jgi:hypothetical protein
LRHLEQTNLKAAAAQQGIRQACECIGKIPPAAQLDLHEQETHNGNQGDNDSSDSAVQNWFAIGIGKIRLNDLSIGKGHGKQSLVWRCQFVETQGDGGDAEQRDDVWTDYL